MVMMILQRQKLHLAGTFKNITIPLAKIVRTNTMNPRGFLGIFSIQIQIGTSTASYANCNMKFLEQISKPSELIVNPEPQYMKQVAKLMRQQSKVLYLRELNLNRLEWVISSQSNYLMTTYIYFTARMSSSSKISFILQLMFPILFSDFSP